MSFYGKIFSSMYDGTLYGQWQAIVTFQQMIVLSGPDGVVDMTPQAISARTSIPFEIIKAGVEVLEQPDPYSRSPDDEGRRIERLDSHRPWGWRIVNYAYYRNLQDSETVREQNRVRQQRKRERDRNGVSRDVTPVTAGHAESRQEEVEVEGKEEDARAREPAPEGLNLDAWSRWDQYRRQIRKPIKPASVLAAQRKLAGYGADQAAVVEHSIANGYTGLWEPKDRPKQQQRRADGLAV